MYLDIVLERAGSGHELVCRDRRRSIGDLPDLGARYHEACGMQVLDSQRKVLVEVGRKLYQWLDGPDGWLRGWLEEGAAEPVIRFQLAGAEEGERAKVAHVPWELLHDGTLFLAERGVVITRVVSKRKRGLATANRYLGVMFLATSPIDVEPVLNYELEERTILDEASRHGLGLVVEESGTLEGVRESLASFPESHLDVLHLTGHGQIDELGRPVFVAEDEVGKAVLAPAKEIGEALANQWPRIVFLSGCHTAEKPANGTAVALVESMVRQGAECALGWARPVYDVRRDGHYRSRGFL